MNEHHCTTTTEQIISDCDESSYYGFIFAFKVYKKPKSKSSALSRFRDSQDMIVAAGLNEDDSGGGGGKSGAFVDCLENLVHKITHSDIIHVEIIPVLGSAVFNNNNNDDDDNNNTSSCSSAKYLKISRVAYSAYIGLGFDEHDSSFCISDPTYKLVYIPMSYETMIQGIEYLHMQKGKAYNYLALPFTILPSWCKKRSLVVVKHQADEAFPPSQIILGEQHPPHEIYSEYPDIFSEYYSPEEEDAADQPSSLIENNTSTHHDHPAAAYCCYYYYPDEEAHIDHCDAVPSYPVCSDDPDALGDSIHTTSSKMRCHTTTRDILLNTSKVFCSQLGLTLCYLCDVFPSSYDFSSAFSRQGGAKKRNPTHSSQPFFIDPMCCTPAELYNLLLAPTISVAAEWPQGNVMIHDTH